jgi:hypothetical protein
VSTAACTRPSATTGRTRLRRKATGSSAGATQPPEGSQPSRTENTVTSRIPATKLGTATPTWLRADSSWPLGRSCRAAASTPAGTASASASAVAVPTSHSVTSNGSRICGPIGARLT